MNKKRPDSYADYTVSDLIADPFFQEWILHPDTEKNEFWNTLAQTRPGTKDTIDKAKNLLHRITFTETMPTDEQVQQALSKHWQAIDNEAIPMRSRPRGNNWLKVAAIITGLALLTAAIWLITGSNKKMVVQTAYGKRQQVWLPDSSKVILNGHSGISWNKHWPGNKKREVWLEGEAFFEVRHLNRNPQQVKEAERFVVYTDRLLIEVLGTSFNIRERRGNTEVVLQTGKIKIGFRDSSHAAIIMQPGDMLRYNAQTHALTTTTTVPENYSAWKEGKLILNNPTVQEIITYLEDNYGKKIQLQNKELAAKKIEGPILLDNLNDALFILSTVLQSDVIKSDSLIIIRKRQ